MRIQNNKVSAQNSGVNSEIGFKKSSTVLLRSILLVICIWFLSISIIFAQSPTVLQFQADCSGPANGSWSYTAKENGSCTCPDSVPLPSLNPAYQIDVCQEGNSLSGALQNISKLKGSVSGQQVNFTITTKFTMNNNGVKFIENLVDTNHGTLQGNAVSGSVSSDWKFNVSSMGVNISCGCKLNGTFKVQLSDSGPGPGPGPGPGDNDPSAED